MHDLLFQMYIKDLGLSQFRPNRFESKRYYYTMIVFNLKEMANTLSPTFDPTVSRFTIYVKTQVPCIMKDDWFSTLAQQRLHACKLVFIRRQIRRNRLL